MLITKWDERLRRTVAIGCGRLISKDGQSPLIKTSSVGTSRIGFSVNTGTTINQKQERTYETMPCAVYSGFYGKEVYEIASTLKKNDLVFFAGWVKEGTYIDETTGKEKESQECRIEFLCPLKLVHQSLFGLNSMQNVDEIDIPSKIITHEDTEEYPI